MSKLVVFSDAHADWETIGVSRHDEVTVKEWSDRSGIPYTTIIYRLNKGWLPERACASS